MQSQAGTVLLSFAEEHEVHGDRVTSSTDWDPGPRTKKPGPDTKVTALVTVPGRVMGTGFPPCPLGGKGFTCGESSLAQAVMKRDQEVAGGVVPGTKAEQTTCPCSAPHARRHNTAQGPGKATNVSFRHPQCACSRFCPWPHGRCRHSADHQISTSRPPTSRAPKPAVSL